jgi:hypothetical protein
MQKTSEVYERVYHYTTWNGLLGILQSSTLWATHYKFLNDYSEIVLFKDKLISWLLPHVRQAYEELMKQSPGVEQKINRVGGLGQAVQHDTEVFVNAQYEVTGDEIYILSFCGEHKDPRINSNGLLSQWRGYGAGGGFALVFNTHKLEEMMHIEAKKYEYSVMDLCDVIYSDDEDKLKKELSEDLSNIAADVKRLFNLHSATLSEKEKRDALKGYYPFVHCIGSYKHCGFKEENEVRMIVLPTVLNQEILKLASSEGITLKAEKERKFRNKNGEFIPYIELFNSIDVKPPIERIIVGPHKEKETRAAALRTMLRNTNIEITCSDIPFIG